MHYEVEEWGSQPGENDDCWTGHGPFATEAEAIARAKEGSADSSTAYLAVVQVEDKLVGDFLYIHKNPHFRPSDSDGVDEWAREQAMEAGMLHGVEAYNDFMGY